MSDEQATNHRRLEMMLSRMAGRGTLRGARGRGGAQLHYVLGGVSREQVAMTPSMAEAMADVLESVISRVEDLEADVNRARQQGRMYR